MIGLASLVHQQSHAWLVLGRRKSCWEGDENKSASREKGKECRTGDCWVWARETLASRDDDRGVKKCLSLKIRTTLYKNLAMNHIIHSSVHYNIYTCIYEYQHIVVSHASPILLHRRYRPSYCPRHPSIVLGWFSSRMLNTYSYPSSYNVLEYDSIEHRKRCCTHGRVGALSCVDNRLNTNMNHIKSIRKHVFFLTSTSND